MSALRNMIALIKEAVLEFTREDPFTLAGAISYYTMLSLAPFLLLLVAIVGLVYGEDAARGEIVDQLADMVGGEAATVAQTILAGAHSSGGGWFSAIISVIVLLFGATTIVAQLQHGIDKIWNVKPKRQPLRAMVYKRLRGLLFILVLGAAVISLLVAGSVVSTLAAQPWAGGLGWAWRVVNIGTSLTVMTVMFAMLLKILPSARLRWSEVLVGAAATSLLFTIGRGLIAIYVGRVGVGSAYGAAGSVIALMAWIYYSSVIVLFGAEITEIYARRARGAETLAA